MPTLTKRCPIWGEPAEVSTGGGDYKVVKSTAIPGSYRISGSAEPAAQTLTPRDKSKVTTWIVDQQTIGELSPLVTTEIISEVIHKPALGVGERVDRLLKIIADLYPSVGGQFRIHMSQDAEAIRNIAAGRSWSESIDIQELNAMLNILVANGYAKYNSPAYVLEFAGWKRLEDFRLKATASDQAFVAMWFSPTMDNCFKSGISPAISNAGYNVMRIDSKEHSNKIDDEIIAEIRRSRFVVADFTSEEDKPRGGVYYEAGFAMGLNIPVIWTCRADMIGNVHFDTRQFNHITWDDPEDLRVKLERRIGAVIGDGPLRGKAS